MNPPRGILFVLLAFNFLLRCVVALRPIEFIDGRTIPDDAYISLYLARNIANGLGPLYGFEYTNGFQPLYVFLMTPVFYLLPDLPDTSVHIALILLTVFDTLALYVLYRYLSLWSHSSWTPILCAIAWIFSAHFFRTSLNGLETSISCFLILSGLYYYQKNFTSTEREPDRRNLFALSAILGLAIFARIDNALLALSIVVIMFWNQLKALKLSDFWLKALILGAGILLMNLPWLLYSYHYTGDFYPVSGKAVRFLSLSRVDHQPTFQGFYLPVVRKAIEILKENNRFILIFSAILLMILIVSKVKSRQGNVTGTSWMPAIFLFCLFLFLAYSFYIFTPWFLERYLFPVSVFFLMMFGFLADRVFGLFQEGRKRLIVFVLIVTPLVGFMAADREFRALFFSKDTNVLGYRNIGLWAKKNFKDGTIIGSPQTGALAYYADNLRVINLDGVVNRACFEALIQRRAMDYIRDSGIEYVIAWDLNMEFIKKHSRSFKEGDLIFVTRIKEFRSWGAEWSVYRVSGAGVPPANSADGTSAPLCLTAESSECYKRDHENHTSNLSFVLHRQCGRSHTLDPSSF